MTTGDSGFNREAARAAINNIISGGVDIHLLSQQGNYTDGSTEINNKSEKSISVPESDLKITDASDLSGTTKLEAANDISFGETDVGTIVDVAIISGENVIIGNEPNTPDLTGEEYLIEQGDVLHEIGNA
jgi:hypothetical protein